MHTTRVTPMSRRGQACGVLLLAGCLLVQASCSFLTDQPTLMSTDTDQDWPVAKAPWQPTTTLPANWAEGKWLWQPVVHSPLQVPLPQIANAVKTSLDAQCVVCHEVYTTAFSRNVHRDQGCESCHGPTSRHLQSRGSAPASIISLKRPAIVAPAVRATSPAEQAEICLQCHADAFQSTEITAHLTKIPWRTSAHAHQGLSCGDCHVAHYNVPPGTPSILLGRVLPPPLARPAVYWQEVPESGSLRGTSNYLAAKSPEGCYRCHAELKRFEEPVHPHAIGTPLPANAIGTQSTTGAHAGTFNCTTCHNPHDNVLATTRKDLCLGCHDGPHMNEWHGSPHDLAGIGCTDCHTPHPAQGRSMQVDQPAVCYRCHAKTRQLEQLAGPHQLAGPNGFQCTSCHRPHGRVTVDTRLNVCLQCHEGAPTMAWHSSRHSREGVMCADCHNAHPDSHVPAVVGLSHTHVRRAERRPMGVDEPSTCYRCHPQVFGQASLPSHHPINEGKILCSDCHDAHQQGYGSLKSETLNQLCFECHAEKEGPFVWEHPPVTESCDHCHNPHGTVANNLLQQPTTILCLRCHSGHSTHNGSPQCTRCHVMPDDPFDVAAGPRDPTIPTTPALRQALFTDCTQCHAQIHGSDFAAGYECGHGMRR